MFRAHINFDKRAYQISPTYVIIGASINPTPKPSNAIPIKISLSEVEKYNNPHPNKCGILTMSIAIFRPIGSVIIPDNALPTIVRVVEILAENKISVRRLCSNHMQYMHNTQP